MASQQQHAGQTSARSRHGNVSAVDVENFLDDVDFPCGKEDLIHHARKLGAPKEVLDVMEDLPEKEYGSAVDVARGVSAAKHY